MTEVAFDEEEREAWVEEVLASILAATGAVRAKIAKKLTGKAPPSPASVYDPAWWENELEGVSKSLTSVAGTQAAAVLEAVGVKDKGGTMAAAVAAVAGAAIAGTMLSRGKVVEERVIAVVETGQEKGWDGERVAKELGVADGAESGPLSDGIAGVLAETAVTGVTGAAVAGVVEAADLRGVKTWNCLMVNSRESHIEADGTTVGLAETFDLEGGEARYPGDPDLPPEEVINCNCWLTYDVEPAETDEPVLEFDEDDLEEIAVAATGSPEAPPIIRLSDRAKAAYWIRHSAAYAANRDGIIVTVEPTPDEKLALAIEGGEPPERLHCTLVPLGSGPLDEATRLAISGALAKVAAACGPLYGKVAGIGWFGAADAMTLALLDVPGLAQFRTEIAAALTDIGFPPQTDYDFLAHICLAYSQVDASSKVGLPVTLNELRFRVGTEVLVFDLLGGIPQPPAAPAVESPPEAPPAPAAPAAPEEPPPTQEASVGYEVVPDHPDCAEASEGGVGLIGPDGALVSCHADPAEAQSKADELNASAEPTATPAEPAAPVTTAVRRFDMPIPADGAPAEPESGSLADVPDEDLEAEVARRLVDAAVAAGAIPPEDADAAVEIALDELGEVMGEVVEDVIKSASDIGIVGPNADEEEMSAKPLGAVARRVLRLAAAAPVAEPPPEAVDGDPNAAGSEYDWNGVLTVEDRPSGDGRMIAAGCLTWRELPVPLMLQTVTAGGHDGAQFCGWIHEIERAAHAILGAGNLVNTDAGNSARDILSDPAGANRFGVSVDIDSVQFVWTDTSGNQLDAQGAMEADAAGTLVELLVAGRIMGATLTPFPAFQEAYITLERVDSAIEADGGENKAIVASAQGEVWRITMPLTAAFGESVPQALVASAGAPAPIAPPPHVFQLKPMEQPEPFAVGAPLPDGTVPCYGLVAQWGTFHIGNRKVQVPRSGDFRKFYTGKKVLCSDGSLVPTGPVFMDTVHPNLMASASDAQAFYAHTGCAAADVCLYTNQWGIVAAGCLRPDATPAQQYRLRASDISPDWRPMDGTHKLVSLLAVNTSGFLVEGIVASAGAFQPWGVFDTVSGEMGAIVAAGAIHQARSREDEVLALRSEVAEMRSVMIELAARMARPRRLAPIERQIRAEKAFALLQLDQRADEKRERAEKAFAALGLPVLS